MANKWLKAVGAAVLTGVLVFGATACNQRWNGNVTLKVPGEVTAGTNGGFVVETENYVYFINGEETYTADNTLGTPVKGALMAAEKAKLGTAEATAEVIVPKLFAAGDTDAGIYLYGDRVYFATPSTKKDTSGNVANDHLEFASMKLDGTDYQEHLTVNGNSTDYRFIRAQDGNVHVIYYDTTEQQVIDYDIAANSTAVRNENAAATACVFLSNEAMEKTGIVALYTVTPKNAGTASDESYNEVYAVKAGEAAKAVLSGKRAENGGMPAATYAISFAKGELVFLTESRTYSDSETASKTYGVNLEDLYETGLQNAVEYKNSALIVSTSVFASLTEAYAAEESYIVKYVFAEKDGKYAETKSLVSKVSATTLLGKAGDDLYYTTSESRLAKTDVTAGAEAKEVLVSTDKVTTDWFAPEYEAGQVFFLDNSESGLSYVNYVSLNAEGVGEDTDDDGEDDVWTIPEADVHFLGERKDSDKTQSVTLKISALSTSITRIEYDRTAAEGERWTQEKQIRQARAAYDALSEELKKEISEDDLKLLEKYENYLAVSKKLMDLAEYVEYDEGGWKLQPKTVTAENKNEYQAKVDEIEKQMDDLGFTASDKGALVNGGLYVLQQMQADIDRLNESN